MEQFSIGLGIGAGLGMGLSLIKGKNGQRLGKPIQRQAYGTKADFDALTNSIANVKTSWQQVKSSIPPVKKEFEVFEKNLEYYQLSITRIIDDLQKETKDWKGVLSVYKYKLKGVNDNIAKKL